MDFYVVTLSHKLLITKALILILYKKLTNQSLNHCRKRPNTIYRHKAHREISKFHLDKSYG